MQRIYLLFYHKSIKIARGFVKRYNCHTFISAPFLNRKVNLPSIPTLTLSTDADHRSTSKLFIILSFEIRFINRFITCERVILSDFSFSSRSISSFNSSYHCKILYSCKGLLIPCFPNPVFHYSDNCLFVAAHTLRNYRYGAILYQKHRYSFK